MAKSQPEKIRYAVVGQGFFAQAAVLPAFAAARQNSRLVALFSDDSTKLRKLGKRYRVDHALPYAEYDDFLASGAVDAVYLAVPNALHRDFCVRAARAGVHVLCEKPLAVTVEDGEAMVGACEAAGVKLMTAYRLHFEKANLAAVDLVASGKLGLPRLFSSVFTLQVMPDNIRTQADLGGGPLHDIGIYCINAARYLLRDEPIEVLATSARSSDDRFAEIDESLSVTMRFPGDVLATFSCSFGAAGAGSYEVLGTRGSLRLDNAYEWQGKKRLSTVIAGKERTRTISARGQIAPEILYFSECIRDGRNPEPSGREGLADLRVIDAVVRSLEMGKAVSVNARPRPARPSGEQEISGPSTSQPELVHAEEPTQEG